MCGPPPMINFACQPNLDKLGHSQEMKFAYWKLTTMNFNKSLVGCIENFLWCYSLPSAKAVKFMGWHRNHYWCLELRKFKKTTFRGQWGLEVCFVFSVLLIHPCTLVTQPMLQLRPNCTELRSMDLFNQILCRFQKYKRKVPPPSLPFGQKKTSFKSGRWRNFLLTFLEST